MLRAYFWHWWGCQQEDFSWFSCSFKSKPTAPGAQSQSVPPSGTVAPLAADGTAVLHAPSLEKHKTVLTMQKGKGNFRKDNYQSSNVSREASFLPKVTWPVVPFLLLRHQPLALGPRIKSTMLRGKCCMEDNTRLAFLGMNVVTQKQGIKLECP